MFVMNFFQATGRSVIKIVAMCGSFIIFSLQSFCYAFRPKMIHRNTLIQIFKIGYLSIPIISLTAIFTGAVLVLQSYSGFSRFNAASSIPIVVVLSIVRELGPVLSALMFVSRVGSSISARIATMKITEQVDAVKMLSVNPLQYITSPYVISGLIVMPILTIIADIIGIFGGYLVATGYLGFNSSMYLKRTVDFLQFSDILVSLVKSIVFGFIVTSVSCFNGYRATGGATGVGNSVINSVTASSILILLLNYIITYLMI